MKTCYKCGQDNADDELYCRNCGHAFKLTKPENSAEMLGGAEEVKRALRSPAFLFAAITATFSLIFTFLNLNTPISAILFLNNGAYSGVLGIGVIILAMLVNIAHCAGLWMIWSNKTRESGFTVLLADMIAETVIMGVLFLLFGDAFAFNAVVLMIFTVVAVCLIIYFIMLLILIGSAKKAVRNNLAVRTAPNYLIAVNFILAVFLIGSMFSGGILTFFTSAANIAFRILIAVCMIKFKHEREN